MRPGGPASPPLAFWPPSPAGGLTPGAGPGRSFFCQVCRLSCSGPEPWRQHVESARHMKLEADLSRRQGGAVADGPSSGVVSSSSSAVSVASSDSPAASPSRRPAGLEARAFFCEVCQLACTGPEPWKQHVQSAKHLKRVSLETAGRGDTGSRPGSALSVEEVLRSGGGPGGLSASPAVSGTGGDTFYCQFCRLSCSGPEPWKQHVQSAKHLKKKTQAEGMAVYSDHTRSSSPSSDIPDGLQSLAVAADSAVPGPPPVCGPPPAATGAGGGSYYCSVCRVPCSGPEPWKQHTESARHLKLASQTGGSVAGGAASSADQSRPSAEVSVGVVADSTPPRSACSTPGPPVSGGGSFYCDACRVPCSGPEPWKQHVQSAKHIKMASQYDRPAAERGSAAGGVSSSTGSSSGCGAVSDGVELGAPSVSPPDASPGSGSGSGSGAASPSRQTWGRALQLPPGSPVSADRPEGGVDGASPQLRGPAAAGGAGDLSGSVSGRSTPVSVTSSNGRFTPAPSGPFGSPYRCEVCQLDLSGPEPLLQHRRGAKHRKMAARRQHAFPGAYADSRDPSPAPAPAELPMDIDPVLGGYDCPMEAGPELNVADPELSFACRSIRIGSRLHDQLDRADGISQEHSYTAGDCIRRVHVEGLVAFLEDIPLIRHNQPFSPARC